CPPSASTIGPARRRAASTKGGLMPLATAVSTSSSTVAGRPPDPLVAPEHLLAALAGDAVDLALGLPLGDLAARCMRRSHLHWSWALVALAFLLLAHAALDGAAPPLAAAALVAAGRGRRWHR